MNKKPLILRTVIALGVIAVFAFSIHPLTQRNFYETFRKLLKAKDNPQAELIITEAVKLQEKQPDLYPSSALLKAADDRGIRLKDVMNGKNIDDNRDAISLIRKQASSSIRLGLDLNGGVEFIMELVPDEEFLKKLEADGEKNKQSRKEIEARMSSEFERYRDIAIETLRKRLEGQKIYEAEIAPSGSRYVALRAPIVAKDEKLKLENLIKMSAKLRFRLVHPENDRLVGEYLTNPKGFVVPVGYELMSSSEFRPGEKPVVRHYVIERRSMMDGKGVVDAFPQQDQFGQRKIILRFNADGARTFGQITTNNINRQLAIVLDGKLYCAPVIRTAIMDGNAEISGSFSTEEAKNISDALVSGSLPFQIRIDAIFDTDPTLGSDNVRNGVWAGLAALLVVVLFMCVYYLRAGVVAVLALGVNVILVLGALAAFDATLTLPGIAGIILTIGMAVDANVLIFERIREELNSGKSLANAIDLGYSKAYTAVIDSNLTTLFTALILMNVGTGPVKGFAITLAIGILTSMFTALFLTRLIFDYIMRFFNLSTLKMCQFLHSPSIDFLKYTKKTFILSAILIVGSLALMLFKGSSMLGVDFTGGTVVTYGYTERIHPLEAEKALKTAGIDGRVTYKSGMAASADANKLEVLVRGDLTAVGADGKVMNPKERISSILNAKYPQAKLTGGQETSVGGLIGKEFSRSAIIAVLLSFVGIIIYVSLRYEFAYAMAGIVALVHDVIIASGIFVLCGREMSLPVIAALLTVIGYSINDTIVIFDRIRENAKLCTDLVYRDVINLSINQTLSRTLLTSVTTLLVVLILFFFGGIAINDFVLVMLLGIVIGTYSSIFIASPLTVMWHRKTRN